MTGSTTTSELCSSITWARFSSSSSSSPGCGNAASGRSSTSPQSACRPAHPVSAPTSPARPRWSLCDALQAETVNEDVKFTTVHMALVRTPMISPTKMYDKFPALTPDQAAGVITDAIVHRPRRASSPFGQFAAVADAVNPAVMDRVRNRAFGMFNDSAAAKGSEPASDTSDLDKRSEIFVQATRGIHW